jgi:hypothetical protein
MKVRCVATKLNVTQALERGFSEGENPRFSITSGKIYTVLGLNFLGSAVWNRGVQALIKDDFGNCAFIPSVLTEITDARASKYWVFGSSNGLDASLWPSDFYTDYFHDDLSEGDLSVIAKFEKICELLSNEHEDEPNIA